MNNIKCSIGELKGMDLILYGAGMQAELDISVLKQANILCFCDADERKQGTSYLGYPVVSIQAAQEILIQNHKAMVYFTPVQVSAYAIARNLIDNHVFETTRILNTEVPLRKYKSCSSLESNLDLDERALNCCCNVQYLKYPALADPHGGGWL